jgi:glycosyltransferase involved in cell wall biosynthesis
MKIIGVHNYHVVRGGSDVMFETTIDVLEKAGFDVVSYTKDNRTITQWQDNIKAAFTGVYSFQSGAQLNDLIRWFKPDLVNVHNFYPQLSPSIFQVCERQKVPVVLRIADYTAICPSSHFFRHDGPCELCSGGREYNCIRHNCLGSLPKSIAYAARTIYTRKIQCYARQISAFFMPSQHVKSKYVENGFPPEKLHVIHNAVDIPDSPSDPGKGQYMAYVGRISPEKGIDLLGEAAAISGIPVRFAGEGSERNTPMYYNNKHVQFTGPLNGDALRQFIRNARAVVIPSLCMETFSLSCAEAMANGIPPIAADIGALPELVEHDHNGLLFEPGNVSHLAKAMTELWLNDHKAVRLGRNAREKAIGSFSRQLYQKRIAGLFECVIGQHKAYSQ